MKASHRKALKSWFCTKVHSVGPSASSQWGIGTCASCSATASSSISAFLARQRGSVRGVTGGRRRHRVGGLPVQQRPALQVLVQRVAGHRGARPREAEDHQRALDPPLGHLGVRASGGRPPGGGSRDHVDVLAVEVLTPAVRHARRVLEDETRT